ncbi:MAG TPA: hydroxymethylglutaryl-CoA lyase [Acidimicrobiales bacterium]|jgi:hydroxymethylglutaryl-CoA lyase|nr:hydroxymethylglutaryl-CoA lyase [Acidimicrobiales bacterium]
MPGSGLPARVTVREVGPRDGLQAEALLRPELRVTLLEALVAAGVTEVEAVAFVSPRAVPAMAGAAEVLAGFGGRPGVVRWALVPNLRGAEMALEAGADALSVTASASEGYSQRNVGMGVDDAVVEVARIAAAAAAAPQRNPAGPGGDKPRVDAVISCAFGSPYEGDIEPGAVAGLGLRLLDGGATSLTLADTTGMATPPRVDSVLARTGTDVGLHLHETRGTGLVNAYAALLAGVTRFDTSVGGLGGSPFAAGAAGNLATEDLVYLLDDLDVSSGIDLVALLGASRLVAELTGHPVPSRVAAAGPRLAR